MNQVVGYRVSGRAVHMRLQGIIYRKTMARKTSYQFHGLARLDVLEFHGRGMISRHFAKTVRVRPQGEPMFQVFHKDPDGLIIVGTHILRQRRLHHRMWTKLLEAWPAQPAERPKP